MATMRTEREQKLKSNLSWKLDANVYELKFYFVAIIFRLGGMNCQR